MAPYTCEMPRQAIKTSPAMARYLRDCRKESGLTLREVHERTAAVGEPIPSSTVCKIEQGKVEPGLVRVRQLLEVYRKPLHSAADLLELEDLVGPAPMDAKAEVLWERGTALLKEGKIREALVHLLPLRPREGGKGAVPKISQKALISLSIGLQQLGKHRLALGMIERLLCDRSCPDPELLVNAHVQAGRIWFDLGSMEVALAFLGRARAHLAAGDIRGEAWILSNEANVLAAGGRYDDAVSRVEAAASLLEASGDVINLVGTFAQIARFKLSAGDAQGSLETARRGLALGEGKGFGERATRLRFWEGRALVALGDHEVGLERLRAALSTAIELDDLSLQFLAHYHLWKAQQELGNTMRAEFELGAARSYLRHTDEDSEEAREVREAGALIE